MFPTSEQSAIPYLHVSLNTRRTSLFLGLLQQVPTAPQYCLQGPQSPVIMLLGGQQLPVINQSINQNSYFLLILYYNLAIIHVWYFFPLIKSQRCT